MKIYIKYLPMIKSGFTLIELLIVIGILAILATVVVLVLNPAEILAQARDSQRISDLGSVKSALALYLSTVSGAVINSSTTCTANNCANPFNQAGGYGVVCATGAPVGAACGSTSSTATNGTGWVTANLAGTTGGPALSHFPLDPTNATSSGVGYYYGFSATSSALGTNVFEIDGRLESIKYRGFMMNDGGGRNCPNSGTGDWITNCWYEIGTAPGLNL